MNSVLLVSYLLLSSSVVPVLTIHSLQTLLIPVKFRYFFLSLPQMSHSYHYALWTRSLKYSELLLNLAVILFSLLQILFHLENEHYFCELTIILSLVIVTCPFNFKAASNFEMAKAKRVSPMLNHHYLVRLSLKKIHLKNLRNFYWVCSFAT